MSGITATMIAAVAIVAVLGCVALVDDASAEDTTGTYTITYVVDGQELSFTGTSPTTTLKSLDELGITLDAGEVMKGWKEDGTSSTVAVGSTVTLTAGETKIFNAVIEAATCTVTFKTIDPTGVETVISTKPYTYGDAIVAPEDPTMSGYVFEGWDTTVAATATADVTYTAVWREIFTVTWVVDGTTIASGTTESEATLNTPADPVKANHEFTGWYDADGTAYSDEYVFASDVVLTAAFRADTYTVTFVYGDDMTVYGTVTAEYGATIVAPAVPSGYVSWDFDFATAITGDTVIKAVAAEPAPGMSTGMQILLYILGVIAVIAMFFVAYGIKTGKIKLKRSA